MIFKWHPRKAQSNEKKHGVTFDEAGSVFLDTSSLTIYDPLHSDYEERFVIIGTSLKNRILSVVHTENGDDIRIISARKATKRERNYYESNVE